MTERIEAALRMLLDSGDITPTGVRIVQHVAEAEIERLTAALDDRDQAIQRVRSAVDGFVPVATGHPQADQMTRIQALKDADAIRRALRGDA